MDAELVRRRLADSRSQAVELIDSGHVLVAGAVAQKPARLVAPEEPVVVLGSAPRYVSRGGDKLEAALRTFEVDLAGREVVDVGASTGGFTDCALQHGATSVVAIDVGRAQLHERLRADPRVTVRERTNVRGLSIEDLGRGPFDAVVADLSFISLRTVAPWLVGLGSAGSDIIVLVKPQFEAGRAEASRGRGVIKDAEVWRTSLQRAIGALEAAGATMMGIMVSPLRGADGNVEFLAHLCKSADEGDGSRAADEIDVVVAQASAGAQR